MHYDKRNRDPKNLKAYASQSPTFESDDIVQHLRFAEPLATDVCDAAGLWLRGDLLPSARSRSIQSCRISITACGR